MTYPFNFSIILATHGLPGLIGALWVALFADGRWGVGWNGMQASIPATQQGVAGLWVAPGNASDIPGQLYAQLAGVGSVVALAFVIPALIFGLARGIQAVAAWLGRPRTKKPQAA